VIGLDLGIVAGGGKPESWGVGVAADISASRRRL
jgi:hypothetical protein